MAWAVIHKAPETGKTPNLADYAAARRDFSWDAARAELDGLPGGGLNIAYEALDRHLAKGLGEKLAIRWLGKTGAVKDFTYAGLSSASNRFASLLTKLGVEKGDRVFTLAGRVPELYVAAFGTLKCGAVFSPLFSVFGPEPIRTRINHGQGKVLVTTAHLYERKIAPWRDQLPSLRHVILIDGGEAGDGVIGLEAAMAAASDRFEIARTQPEDMALLHFTSGTTGTPKGAIHVHDAVLAHHITGKYALDLHGDDIFWCTADPGWVTGTSYGIIAPLTNGVTMIVDDADFDAERWYDILRNQKVSVWYTAPTAIRMLMRGGAGLIKPGTFDTVRFMVSGIGLAPT